MDHPATVGGGERAQSIGHNGDPRLGGLRTRVLRRMRRTHGRELALMPARRATAEMTKAGLTAHLIVISLLTPYPARFYVATLGFGTCWRASSALA